MASALVASPLKKVQVRFGSLKFALEVMDDERAEEKNRSRRPPINASGMRRFFRHASSRAAWYGSAGRAGYDLVGIDLNDTDVADFVRATAHLPNLRVCKFGVPIYFSTRLDEGLAECLRTNRRLEEITVQCPRPAEHEADLGSAPSILQALVKNYTVRYIRFHPRRYIRFHPRATPTGPAQFMQADTIKSIDTLLGLNRAGRGYLAEDPTNAAKAIAILGQVSDDSLSDGLFVHLLDNPFPRGQTTTMACRTSLI